MNKLLLLGGIALLTSCDPPTDKASIDGNADSAKVEREQEMDPNAKSYGSLEFAKTETISDTSLQYIIDKECAISIMPDTSWINEQQQSMGEDDWSTIVDDHQFYEAQATDTLQAYNITTIFKDNDRRYIAFKKRGGGIFTIDRAKMKDSWGLILFNGKDNPVLWLSTEIDDAVREVYKRK